MKALVLEVSCLTTGCWFKEAPEAPKTIQTIALGYLPEIHSETIFTEDTFLVRHREMTVDLSRNYLPCNLVLKVPERAMQASGKDLSTTALFSYRHLCLTTLLLTQDKPTGAPVISLLLCKQPCSWLWDHFHRKRFISYTVNLVKSLWLMTSKALVREASAVFTSWTQYAC